jgi:hypothetical protein
MSNIYLGLVHYPVYNKNHEIVQTSVTNLDIHDIARTALTFGINTFYIITPDATQVAYVTKMVNFWSDDKGEIYNQDRSMALSIIKITSSIESGIDSITTLEGMRPIVISTTARDANGQVSCEHIAEINRENKPLMVLFGTGHGLAPEVHKAADYILKPISGMGNYNHLSVRSAAAIIFDRITSAVYKGRN